MVTISPSLTDSSLFPGSAAKWYRTRAWNTERLECAWDTQELPVEHLLKEPDSLLVVQSPAGGCCKTRFCLGSSDTECTMTSKPMCSFLTFSILVGWKPKTMDEDEGVKTWSAWTPKPKSDCVIDDDRVKDQWLFLSFKCFDQVFQLKKEHFACCLATF